jgi:hypothetical protein
MLRVPLALSYYKRTIRPLYANTQATPKAMYLDPAWDRSVDILPGMALAKTSGENVTLLGASPMIPYGLSAFFEAPVLGITEIANQGVNAVGVWVLGPDAEFEVLAPAFDASVSWTDPGDGSIVLISAYTGASGSKRGVLCPSTATNAATVPIARLIAVSSANKIVIGGLQGRVA